MTNKRKIRIVKKRDVQALKSETEVQNETERESTRRLIRTISKWARAVEERRRAECERANSRLFVNRSPIEQV